MRLLPLFGSLLFAATTVAQTHKASDVADFVSIDTSAFVLDHVRVIDGTGGPAKEDQAIVIADGKIQSIGPAASLQIPQGAQRIDRSGYTVIPGLVGMHDHMFYPMGNGIFGEMAFSFPRLYLAGGVTTIRTTGALEPYTDLELKKQIEEERTRREKRKKLGEIVGHHEQHLKRLANPDFLSKAAPEMKEQMQLRADELETQRRLLGEQLRMLGGAQ